nr:hypothetical protein BaRGS_011703 [Batillaria attramentaria]
MASGHSISLEVLTQDDGQNGEGRTVTRRDEEVVNVSVSDGIKLLLKDNKDIKASIKEEKKKKLWVSDRTTCSRNAKGLN